jgi:hypothetical protein
LPQKNTYGTHFCSYFVSVGQFGNGGNRLFISQAPTRPQPIEAPDRTQFAAAKLLSS